ncbi:MAG: hypothetical protein ATN35_12180 [Epulopiscium sp. Nele67-Bin004]|nr:MAG: hypothetical protein ATN35_12180 [Epulopiscium sp. Nele67-Bin004]
MQIYSKLDSIVQQLDDLLADPELHYITKKKPNLALEYKITTIGVKETLDKIYDYALALEDMGIGFQETSKLAPVQDVVTDIIPEEQIVKVVKAIRECLEYLEEEPYSVGAKPQWKELPKLWDNQRNIEQLFTSNSVCNFYSPNAVEDKFYRSVKELKKICDALAKAITKQDITIYNLPTPDLEVWELLTAYPGIQKASTK